MPSTEVFSPQPIQIEDLARLRSVEDPQPSPDGRHIACVIRGVEMEKNGYRTAIYLFPSDGSPGRRLTAGPRDSGPRWSPDGSRIAFLRAEPDKPPQIHCIDIEGGEARCLTDLKHGADSPAWSPEGKRLAFVAAIDAEGRAKEAAGSGESENGQESMAKDPSSSDGESKSSAKEPDRADPRVIDRLPYRSGTRYLERERHIYVMEVEAEADDGLGMRSKEADRVNGKPTAPRRITDGDGTFGSPAWSADGAEILCWGMRDWSANDLFGAGEALAILASGGAPRRLDDGLGRPSAPLPSPCGRYVAWATVPKDRPFSIGSHLLVAAWRPADGSAIPSPLPVLCRSAAFDRVIEGFEWAEDGGSLVLRCPDRGAARLFRWNLDAALAGGDSSRAEMPDLDAIAWARADMRPEVPGISTLGAFDDGLAYVTSFAMAGGKLAATVAKPEHPAELFVLDGDEAASARRLTAVNAEILAERQLATTEELWFEAPDGAPVQGWLIRPPAGADAANMEDLEGDGQSESSETAADPESKSKSDANGDRPKTPLVLEIHGGPHSMWGPGEPTMWHEFQILAAKGLAVFYCNPRGSNGYGRRHRMAIHNNWGFAEEQDFLWGIDAALARGGLDPERVVVTGGSYGGYMTAWLIARHDRFRAAVSQRGVYELVAFSGSTDIPRFTEEIFETPTWRDPARLWRHSPLAYVEGIHTPLLILHAEQDYRAPIIGAEQLFSALKRLGRKVTMVRYPREGHELSRSGEPKHRIDRLERIVGWFESVLGRSAVEPVAEG